MFKFVEKPQESCENLDVELEFQILKALEWWYDTHTERITVRKLSEMLKVRNVKGSSVRGVHEGLTNLVEMGYITKVNGEVRLTHKLWKE